MLKRAINTLQVVLENSDQLWIPVEKTWRLNERHYGDLQVGQTPVSWVLTTVEAGDSICIWGPVGPAIKQQVVPNSLIKQCWVLAELPLHLHACRGRTRLKRPRSMVMRQVHIWRRSYDIPPARELLPCTSVASEVRVVGHKSLICSTLCSNCRAGPLHSLRRCPCTITQLQLLSLLPDGGLPAPDHPPQARQPFLPLHP